MFAWACVVFAWAFECDRVRIRLFCFQLKSQQWCKEETGVDSLARFEDGVMKFWLGLGAKLET